ncbi:hypothetical protein KUC3_39390 [Alteromonas sp. KC3]|uniref:FtsK/SpoIIIE domain-containing protein n=1 Tax=unclassified Alteromonas TaxID=2614992 RepID=UPI0019215744|nr:MULTISPECIES: FtsK/SpoIIIE domain-containing protein [unclassified Alteromonas]BCO21082.1 hypothetical protein KUC3_39390 [Alteromonas sp. KC3]BCO25052.1 hypothetical protein KUC14_39210 [Alteromonas sp. KC14]
MTVISKAETVISETVVEIVLKIFASQKDVSHKCFRIKNLLKNEIIEFINVWNKVSHSQGEQKVKVLIAGDADKDYPDEYRADSGRSITWYRNNNDSGLVYLETKTESDEQGLKNIFTFQDRNFLDNFFKDEIDIPKVIIAKCWELTLENGSAAPDLFTQKLLDVLNLLHPHKTQVPVRRFVNFVLGCCESFKLEGSNHTLEKQVELIGRNLVYLGLFPDEFWSEGKSDSSIARRLELNLSYAELATSNNTDIEPEDVYKICSSLSFKDIQGNEYPLERQQVWKELCLEYSKTRRLDIRKEIPFRIFEQLFAKDVKGLQLGDRVEQELSTNTPKELEQFLSLNIKSGLNERIQDSALELLKADSIESGIPLADFLSKQTKRMVDKVAFPTPENFINPLIKLTEIARDFYPNYGNSQCEIELRLGKAGDVTNPSIGLFAFIYGSTLKSVAEASRINTEGFEFSIEECLVQPKQPPRLSQNSDVYEEEVSVDWKAIPLEFVVRDLSDGTELDISSNYEWLPSYYPYLALSWIWCFEQPNLSYFKTIKLPQDIGIDDWLLNICNRTLTIEDCLVDVSTELQENEHILSTLAEDNLNFCESSKKYGLNREFINELIDKWEVLVDEAKHTYVPFGKTHEELSFLLSRDVIDIGNEKRLMLPNHPLRLRWISKYFEESEQNANLALSGNLKLNPLNDSLYINWLSDLSPHQQPPILATKERNLLFATGEQGWCEEFAPLGTKHRFSKGGVLDYPSIIELAKQVKTYLEAHPYKQDGLQLLLILQQSGRFASELIKEIRKGEFKSTKINLHVLSPKRLWEEVILNFEDLPTENRISEGNELFPPLQLRLYDLEGPNVIPSSLREQSFDVALVPGLLKDQLNVQHNTEPPEDREGRFDTLLDSPNCLYGGQDGGEISVSMLPRDSDVLLKNWSTMVVREVRSGAVSKQQPENTDYVELKISFQETAKLYEQLHELAHWVVILERYLSRSQVENLEPKPDILTVRNKVGTNSLYTLIVSSNSGKKFIINRLERKLRNILQKTEHLPTDQELSVLASRVYENTRKVSPQLVLKAMGISRVTEEILGLMIATHLSDLYFPSQISDGAVIWISLDEHPEWFPGRNTTRADLCRLTLEVKEEELYVDALIVEGKFRQSFDSHGVEQVKASLELIETIIETETEAIDARLWREHLLTAMESVNPEARMIFGLSQAEVDDKKRKLPEKTRQDFRNGNYQLRNVKGLFSICCYLEQGQLISPFKEGDIFVVKSYQEQILDLISGHAKSLKIDNKDNANLGNSLVLPDETKHSEKEASIESNLSEKLINKESQPKDSFIKKSLSEDELINRYQVVLDKFGEFGVSVQQPEDKSMRFVEGPASILYRLKPGNAVAPKKLYEKADVLKLALALEQDQNIRFGNHQGFVTIDVPKKQEDRYFVSAKDIWKEWRRPTDQLAAPIGEDTYGKIVDINFSSSNCPHLLIGGTTGSGKSEALNTILDGLIEYYSEQELRIMLVDPKGTELQQYEDDPHLEGSIGWDDTDAIALLEMAVAEMQSRYIKLKSLKTRSLPEYNAIVDEESKIPWWVVVLDEYADLTSEKESKKTIEGYLKRLAQKARAAGIHVIIATQKPSAEVISTNLRSNLPAQLALRVKSATESRVIIDEAGAETLNGKGDALIKMEGKLTRIQCAKT